MSIIGTEVFNSYYFSKYGIYAFFLLTYCWVIPIFGFLPILIFQIIDTDRQNYCCCSGCEVQRTYLSTDDEMVEVYVVKRDYNIENIMPRREQLIYNEDDKTNEEDIEDSHCKFNTVFHLMPVEKFLSPGFALLIFNILVIFATKTCSFIQLSSDIHQYRVYNENNGIVIAIFNSTRCGSHFWTDKDLSIYTN